MSLIEIALIAVLAPVIALLFERWDRRTIARRNAVLARLSAQSKPSRQDEPLEDRTGDLASGTEESYP